MFGGNRGCLRLDQLPDVLVHLGTDQYLLAQGASGITRSAVHDVSNNGKFHSVGCTDKPLDHFSAVDADSDPADARTTSAAGGIQPRQYGLHLQGGSYRVFMMRRIRLRASKDGQDRVPHELVNHSMVGED